MICFNVDRFMDSCGDDGDSGEMNFILDKMGNEFKFGGRHDWAIGRVGLAFS